MPKTHFLGPKRLVRLQTWLAAQTTPQAPQFWRSAGTQVPPQSSPELQTHWLLSQRPKAPQLLPQAPQLSALEVASTQMPLQRVVPVGQTQEPFWQTRPPVQALPQLPQCRASLWSLVQTPPQLCIPVGQAATQLDSRQTWAPVQAPPQLPPQVPGPASQTHLPCLHDSPGPQVTSQAPQLRSSEVTSAQVLPQICCPAGHLQAPSWQVEPLGQPHFLPHLPQCSSWLRRSTQG